MSGGSFDYLCYVLDISDLYEKRRQLELMADALLQYDGEDAAKETLSLIFDMRAFEIRMEAHLERLAPVWKAVEWHHSSDWRHDDVLKALVKYRGLENNHEEA